MWVRGFVRARKHPAKLLKPIFFFVERKLTTTALEGGVGERVRRAAIVVRAPRGDGRIHVRLQERERKKERGRNRKKEEEKGREKGREGGKGKGKGREQEKGAPQ